LAIPKNEDTLVTIVLDSLAISLILSGLLAIELHFTIYYSRSPKERSSISPEKNFLIALAPPLQIP
jgi:hypothetical protein